MQNKNCMYEKRSKQNEMGIENVLWSNCNGKKHSPKYTGLLHLGQLGMVAVEVVQV